MVVPYFKILPQNPYLLTSSNHCLSTPKSGPIRFSGLFPKKKAQIFSLSLSGLVSSFSSSSFLSLPSVCKTLDLELPGRPEEARSLSFYFNEILLSLSPYFDYGTIGKNPNFLALFFSFVFVLLKSGFLVFSL